MTIDLHVSTDSHVTWSDPGVVVVNVLVLVTVKELALYDSRVLLGWLIDRDAVISQVEGNDEAAINVFRHASVEASCEPENLLVIIDALEEIALWLVWDELVDVAKGVFFASNAVVGWHLDRDCFWWRWELNLSNREIVAIHSSIEVLGRLVHAFNFKDAAVSVNVTRRRNLVAGQIVVTNEGLSWLVDIEAVGELLSTEKEGESVTAIVGVVDFTDLDSVIGQVVVDDEWEVVTAGEESENATVVVQELLLGGNFAATEGFLEELLHLRVSLGCNLD